MTAVTLALHDPHHPDVKGKFVGGLGSRSSGHNDYYCIKKLFRNCLSAVIKNLVQVTKS